MSLDPGIKCLLDEIKSDHEINQGHENNEAGCAEEGELKELLLHEEDCPYRAVREHSYVPYAMGGGQIVFRRLTLAKGSILASIYMNSLTTSHV